MSALNFGNINANEGFEPFMTPHGQEGEALWIRKTGDDGVRTQTCIWYLNQDNGPQHLDITLEAAETYLILEGELEIQVESETEIYSLKAGDIITFEKDISFRLSRITDSVKSLLVIAE